MGMNAVEAEVSHHVVHLASRDGSATSLKVAVPLPSTTVQLASVPAGHDYVVTLSSVGVSGEGPSKGALVKVQETAPMVSTDDSGIFDTQSIYLQWPSFELEGSSIVGYRIWSRAGDSDEWRVLVDNTGSSEPSTVCTVPRGVEQQFSVAALTPQGISAVEVNAVPAHRRLPDMVQSL